MKNSWGDLLLLQQSDLLIKNSIIVHKAEMNIFNMVTLDKKRENRKI